MCQGLISRLVFPANISNSPPALSSSGYLRSNMMLFAAKA